MTSPITLLLLFASFLMADTRPVINIAWLPVTEAERRLSAPVVDKNAGIEALFWRAHVYDEFQGQDAQRVLHHYVRLKVFNAAGKEKASSLDIEFDQDTSVLAIAGRTIKADGSVVELEKDGIHERDLVRAGRLKRRVKTLTMPAVEPGAIVEYRWKEIQFNPRSWNLRLQFQREYPIQKVHYYLKPISSDYAVMPKMRLLPFNCVPSPFKVENDGFNSLTVENVPAFKEEPLMLGEPNVRAWALLAYHEDSNEKPEKYWNDVGKEEYQHLRRALKVTDEVKQACAKALEGVKAEDKTIAILRFIRANVRGVLDASVTDAERAKVLKDMPKDRWRSSAEVLKSGIALPGELNTLFAAMATHAGLDVRPALVADRDDVVFNPGMMERYFLRNVRMTVKQGEEWKLLDVSARRLPAGMVGWREEGMQALVSDQKKPFFITSPLAPPEASETRRVAKLSLLDDGTLEGDVVESYTGHAAAERRVNLDRESEARRQELLKKAITGSLAKAEVSAIAFEGIEDPEVPVKIRYRIKVPGYGQRTGKRLFFQPMLFQQGDAPLFEASERQYDIYFRYAWKESDEIAIALPKGFELDNAEAPQGLAFGAPGGYLVDMKLAGGRLICKRELIFGQKGIIGFPKSGYPVLKKAFDEIHRRDGHSMSLKMAAGL